MNPIQSKNQQEFTQAIGKYYNRCDFLYERVKCAIENVLFQSKNLDVRLAGLKNLERLAQAKKIAFFDLNNGQGIATLTSKGRFFETELQEINQALPEMNRADLTPGKNNPSILALLRTKVLLAGFDLSPEEIQESFREVPSVAGYLHQEWQDECELNSSLESYQILLKQLEMLITQLQNGIFEFNETTFISTSSFGDWFIGMNFYDTDFCSEISLDAAHKPENCVPVTTRMIKQAIKTSELCEEINETLMEKINLLKTLQENLHENMSQEEMQKSMRELKTAAQLIYDKYQLSDSTLHALKERSALNSPAPMPLFEDRVLLARILSYSSKKTFESARAVSHLWFQVASTETSNKNNPEHSCSIL